MLPCWSGSPLRLPACCLQAVLRCSLLRHHVAALGGDGSDGSLLVSLLAAPSAVGSGACCLLPFIALPWPGLLRHMAVIACTGQSALGGSSGMLGSSSQAVRLAQVRGLAVAALHRLSSRLPIITWCWVLPQVLAPGAIAEVLQWEARTTTVMLEQQQRQRQRG